ncbi:hypothetical protein [Pseudooceanicola sp. MF1-13]|uniref:hypothetical protein n=1 Tax=Pseudooceanicola sp. MF1-13 TaxID=3379095 RepID=UPI00389248BB
MDFSTLHLGRIAEHPEPGALRQVRGVENPETNVKSKFASHRQNIRDLPQGDPEVIRRP